MRPLPSLMLTLCLLTLTSGCYDGASVDDELTGNTLGDPTQVRYAPELGVDLAAMHLNASGLYWQDLHVPTEPSPMAREGAFVNVYFTAWTSTGAKVDTNAGAVRPLQFYVPSTSVIPGLVEGVAGMRVGGKRRLVVPPELAFGATPTSNIPAYSVLVIEVELMSVRTE